MLVNIDGKKIAQIRKEKKITQAELAACAGISTRTLSSYEVGETKSCRSEILEKIADELDVFINDLIVDGTYNSNVAIIKLLFSGAEKQGIYLPTGLKRALILTADLSMQQRVEGILDHLFYVGEDDQFSNTEFFYEYKRDIYHIIGDYFVCCRAANFTKGNAETNWTKILNLLKGTEPVVSSDMIESFRACRIKSDEERRNLLVYVYHYLLEKYDDINFLTAEQEDSRDNLEKKVHHIFVLICSLLCETENVDKNWVNNFCIDSGMALQRYLAVKCDETILESKNENDEYVKARYIEDRIEKFIRLRDEGLRDAGSEPDSLWYRGNILDRY